MTVTRHWVEAYVAHDEVHFRLVCEYPEACMETGKDDRGISCAVADFFDDMGTDLLEFPRSDRRMFGRIEVRPEWTGYEEDGECRLIPADSPAAAGSQLTSVGEPNWRRLALKLAAAPLADYVLLTTRERDFIEAQVTAERERQAIADDSLAERTADAGDGGPDA